MKAFLPLFTSLLAIAILTGCSLSSNKLSNSDYDSTYHQVMASGAIRCAYATYPPYCIKDPNTGKLSGIFVEIMEEAGKKLGLKVDWAEEVGWGTIIQGLESNRYDLVPMGVWPNANRGRHASFSTPLFYNGLGIYVRVQDNRFNNNIKAIDSKYVTISMIDGYITADITKKLFPHAHTLTHPDMCDGTQLFLDIVNKKADVTIIDPSLAALFLKNNPGTIKNISAKPVQIEANTMMFKIGQPAFKSMLDTALNELINIGYVDAVLSKYEPKPGVYLRLAAPYQTQAPTKY